MLIGVPKEIKNNENRVAMTPAGVHELVSRGHSVLVEKSAGVGSGFADDDYEAAGANLASSNSEVWSRAEMIVKVKEPIEAEYRLMPQILGVLARYQHPVAITTKGSGIVRDIAQLAQMQVRVGISITTRDPKLSRVL